MSLEQAIAAERQLQQLRSWRSLRELTDSQSHNPYTLRGDINLSLLCYCGQAFAGATNYHDAPEFLRDAVRKKLEGFVPNAVELAIAELDARLVTTIREGLRLTQDLVKE